MKLLVFAELVPLNEDTAKHGCQSLMVMPVNMLTLVCVIRMSGMLIWP